MENILEDIKNLYLTIDRKLIEINIREKYKNIDIGEIEGYFTREQLFEAIIEQLVNYEVDDIKFKNCN